MDELGQKIRRVFSDIAILKNPDNNTVFDGRNLPSFVKDFLIRMYVDENGVLDKDGIKLFLDQHIPNNTRNIKNRLTSGETVQMLTRFIISTNIRTGETRFAIPDASIKDTEAKIPEYLMSKHRKDLIDGEQWGVITLIYNHPVDRSPGYIEMADYNPFRPYEIDLDYFRDSREEFTIEEWIDVLITAMEYNPKGFLNTTQKIEFLSRLLVFVEPNLNMIELAPKGTGKSYVFGNLSKHGWLVSGGRVSRARLFYDRARKQPGIIYNYDFITFDEIQTITFQEPSEMQSALKSYLEAGKTTIDNFEFISQCSTMLMGNIPLDSENRPISHKYFTELPDSFRESALLDRFHGFIEGWLLPRMHSSLILKGWTLNVEYFSGVLHLLRTAPEYGLLVNDAIYTEKRADLRDLKAVKKIASAYCKLLFPHITDINELDKDNFRIYCLEPAIRRRGIIKQQCHKIDPEFKEYMHEIGVK